MSKWGDSPRNNSFYNIRQKGDNMVEQIVQLINSTGVPVACLVATAWYIFYRENKNDVKEQETEERHAEQMAMWKSSIDANTEVIKDLSGIIKDMKVT